MEGAQAPAGLGAFLTEGSVTSAAELVGLSAKGLRGLGLGTYGTILFYMCSRRRERFAHGAGLGFSAGRIG